MRNFVRFFIGWQTLVVCIGLFPAPAQVSTADIVGTVLDPTGAVLTGVKVTATNSATGFARAATSNDSGSFLISLLPIGNYSVKAETNGFKVSSIPEVTLAEGDRLRLDLHMEVGAVAESIEVKAQTASLQA